ncbi:hypothetical protein MalM25_25980 [Planctomycetes bacterium MalM25]|nr:hypothetical protein MalM25_25980 [Planctomycetes bacterium MalM25]
MPLLDYWFELTTMAVLVTASAFFSGSEAALFSISRSDRTDMAGGSPSDRRAAGLLARPERLLTAILFWNLVVNLTYYALTEVVAMRLRKAETASAWAPLLFTLGALFAIILLSEVLPKSLAVLRPRWLSGLVAAPLSAAARLVDPLLPPLQSASNACARLMLPKLRPEPYLELADLEKAVELRSDESIDNKSLMMQERQVLQRLVELADLTAAELMRPRNRCLVLRPPVSLDDLVGQTRGVGEYVLVTEPETDEIAGAVPISRLAMLPPDRLDRRAEPLTIVPWCASAADALNRLRDEGRRVAVVINELGETIGIVPLERLLDSVLRDATHIDPHDAYAARLVPLGERAWEASGATPLRRVTKLLKPWATTHGGAHAGKALAATLTEARSLTVGGLLQEVLERSACLGDRVEAGGLVWIVTDGSAEETGDDPLVVRIELLGDQAALEAGEGGPR